MTEQVKPLLDARDTEITGLSLLIDGRGGTWTYLDRVGDIYIHAAEIRYSQRDSSWQTTGRILVLNPRHLLVFATGETTDRAVLVLTQKQLQAWFDRTVPHQQISSRHPGYK